MNSYSSESVKHIHGHSNIINQEIMMNYDDLDNLLHYLGLPNLQNNKTAFLVKLQVKWVDQISKNLLLLGLNGLYYNEADASFSGHQAKLHKKIQLDFAW